MEVWHANIPVACMYLLTRDTQKTASRHKISILFLKSTRTQFLPLVRLRTTQMNTSQTPQELRKKF